ncbi:lytic transglycosylase domain-containing protein [Luteibacter yeojuensis]|uniref:Lytic transglycosylase domain-containing protein n=1 Tax=Luteibacter yeojuensis TaxID=345309 RepID=A0A7X5TNM6_9GAMM|nr:lytic transglycosylase domain-containing protein [Luteibacter yeojuensis]NID13864.1 lytic transglycosylase domain-containing protein [Luteibacter yeojuensis]
MVQDATPGGSAGHRACRFLSFRTVLRRTAIGCVLLLGLCAGPAVAGTLYRCTGSTGETVFSGSTSGYKDCKRIGSTPNPRAARPKGVVAERAPAKPSLEGVVGSVVTAPSTAASFVGVTASVIGGPTEGEALPPVTAPKGRWDYRESSSQDLAASAASAAPKGSRVLRGAVYRITRADGGVEYTNIPPGGGAKGQSIKMLFTYIATCAACDVHSKIDWNSVALNLTSYGDAIRSASSEFGVDEALLRAVIHAESAFNPRALSVAGAQGLMQLIPGTARDMGVLDAFDAGQNIRGGARYLALLLRNFNGNEKLAAAAYNAGPGAVQKYNGVPPYDETQVYVERVGVLRKRYAETLKRHAATGIPLADRGA